MKKLVLLVVFVAGLFRLSAQDIYTSRNAELYFFSSAPLENIEARSTMGVSALNIQTKAIYFKVDMTTFQFRKKLMQEHFNENYLESDKYPYAEFKGKILEQIDLTKEGTYPVTVEGKLTIHGVEKAYREKATLVVKEGRIYATSNFKVRVADHNIKIPTLVIQKIAEVVDVKVTAIYDPVKK